MEWEVILKWLPKLAGQALLAMLLLAREPLPGLCTLTRRCLDAFALSGFWVTAQTRVIDSN